MKRNAILLAVLLVLSASLVSAQSLTGVITGKVVDEQGAVLPGVVVTLTGKQGSQTAVSDARGEYRFVGLNPGLFELKAELSGFTPRTEKDVDLAIGKTLSVDFTLKVGGLTDSIEVTANSSTIDVTTTATDNSLSQDILQNMPINLGNFNAATQLLNFTPGVNSGSAFGGDASFGNALLIDGVDTRDPEGGSAWVFFNYNIVEEVQVGGIGAPAEYGGFTGAIVNTVTKSGGNNYSGLFEVRHTNDGLAGNNISAEYLKANPGLGDPNVITKLNDYTVQLGGPIARDKVFWWASAQRYAFEQDPAGPRTIATEVSPRYNGKLTFQLSPADTLITSFQYDNYNVTGRVGKPPVNAATDQQTLDQDSPEAIWNFQYRKVFGSSTFLEAKYTGYWGYYYLDPISNVPSRTDLGTGEFTGGAGYFYYADRGRNQVNLSLSSYADKFGKHNFKFGVEIERSKSRSRYGYTNDVYFADYYGLPYLAYSYGYDIDGRNRRASAYAQDQWQAGRLTANLGLRLDRIRGYSPEADETVYTPKLAVNPRLGMALDLSGKGTSVLRAFYGRYYEGASFNPWQRAVPGRSDYVTSEVIGNRLVESDRVPELVYGIDSEIDHLNLDEVNGAFEQQLRRDMRVTVTGIYRKYGNFINAVIPTAQWTPFTYTQGFPGQPVTLYRLANRAASVNNRFIQNIDGFQYKDPSGNVLGTVDAYRDYKGVMLVLTKAYSNRWQGQASYVWSEARGSIANTGTASVAGSNYLTPNAAIVNVDGRMENDRTHEFKVFAGYQIPKIEVSLNAYFRSVSGQNYTPVRLVGGSTFNYPSSVTVNLEERGSRRYDTLNQIDIRAEKSFRFDVHRFGLFVDAQNLFNVDTVTGRQTRYPSRVIAGNTVQFDAPTAVVSPRQLTFGGRWSF